MKIPLTLFMIALCIGFFIGVEAEVEPNQKTIVLSDGSEMVIDYSRGVVEYMGVETPMIVDQLQMPMVPPKEFMSSKLSVVQPTNTIESELPYDPNYKTTTTPLRDTRGYVHLPYYDYQGNVSLDVYIEDTFYAANQAALDDFWDKFVQRFEILKERTGWSSKKLFGVPLEIYVYGHDAACYGGNASPTHSNVVFSNPMYKTGCNKPYYENGSTHYNNPGELGDWWPYMNTALHEALHSINPYPIYTRSWLTEGWSEYEMYNTLTVTVPGNSIPDINQETADTYLYNGFAGYQWDPYVANDYHDTTVYNRELQRSHGYDIVGHMFSKMVYEEGMEWNTFYGILNNNKESLDRTFSLGPPYIYYTDAFVLNVFGKAMGHTDWLTQTDPLFNYYTTPGHGYGARNISHSNMTIPMPYGDFDWFGDMTSTIALSEDNVAENTTVNITATIYNEGDVNMKNISVRLYVNNTLLYETFLDINKFQNKNAFLPYTPTETGLYVIEVRVDEDNIKIELDDTNNHAMDFLLVNPPNNPPILGPIGYQLVDEGDLLQIQLTATDPENDTLSYNVTTNISSSSIYSFSTTTGLFEWTPSYTEAGFYEATFSVTDGEYADEETVYVEVIDVNQAPILYNIRPILSGEMKTIKITARATDNENDTLNYSISSPVFAQDDNVFTWWVGPHSSGSYDFEVSVTDGNSVDSQIVHVTIVDTCQIFLKPQGMWDCESGLIIVQTEVANIVDY